MSSRFIPPFFCTFACSLRHLHLLSYTWTTGWGKLDMISTKAVAHCLTQFSHGLASVYNTDQASNAAKWKDGI
eukprot:768558-Amphidinium_carterae.1